MLYTNALQVAINSWWRRAYIAFAYKPLEHSANISEIANYVSLAFDWIVVGRRHENEHMYGKSDHVGCKTVLVGNSPSYNNVLTLSRPSESPLTFFRSVLLWFYTYALSSLLLAQQGGIFYLFDALISHDVVRKPSKLIIPLLLHITSPKSLARYICILHMLVSSSGGSLCMS